MKFKLLSLTIAANLLSYIFSDDTCPVFKCVKSKLGDDLCMIPENDNKNIIDVQSCIDNFHCKYDFSTLTGKCEKIDYSPKQFIRGPCITKADCVPSATDCVKNVCVNESKVPCKDDVDCAIGSYCDKTTETSVCLPQVPIGGKCSAEIQCVNEAGCLKGICTRYFSLEDGTDVEKDENRFLCQSAFTVDNKCATVDLVSDKLCTNSKICTYAFKNGTKFNSTSSCVCGKNEVGNSYCRPGVNSDEFKKDLNIQKKFFNNTNCHTTERFIPCAAYGNNTDANIFNYKKELKNMHNTIIKNHVAFTNVSLDSCILPVVGGFDANIIPPVSILACPKYTCGNEDICAKSFNPNNWNSSDIQITLTKGVCFKNQTCSVVSNINNIYYKENVTFTCENMFRAGSKEAGEKCSTHDDCINKNCTSKGVCKYIAIGEECDFDDTSRFCGIGAYCSKQIVDGNQKNICVSQKGKDQKCNSTFECENSLICYNNTCSIELGSKDDTFQLEPSLTILDKVYYPRICKSLEFNYDVNRCITYKYHPSHTVNSDGYVACEIKDKKECLYVDNFNNTIARACECGYNANGNSYCPIEFGKRIIYNIIKRFLYIFHFLYIV